MLKPLLLSTKSLIYTSLISFLFFSCSSNLSINDFDKESWKKDYHGCNKNRAEQLQTIIDQKDKLIGSDISDITQLLGAPNIKSLNKRMGKIYMYTIHADTTCGGLRNNKMLHIELEPLGRVKIVTVK